MLFTVSHNHSTGFFRGDRTLHVDVKMEKRF